MSFPQMGMLIFLSDKTNDFLRRESRQKCVKSDQNWYPSAAQRLMMEYKEYRVQKHHPPLSERSPPPPVPVLKISRKKYLKLIKGGGGSEAAAASKAARRALRRAKRENLQQKHQVSLLV